MLKNKWIREMFGLRFRSPWVRYALFTLFSTILYIAPGNVYATGTPAGTSIDNSITATYFNETIGGAALFDTSNVASTTVLQSESVSLEVASESAALPLNDTTYILRTVTNLGNGGDSFDLAGSTPVNFILSFIQDDNQDGTHQITEITAITSADSMAPDETKTLFVAIYVPTNAVYNPYIPITLTATSRSDSSVADTSMIFGRTQITSIPSYINIVLTFTDDPGNNELDVQMKIINGNTGEFVPADLIPLTIRSLTSGVSVLNVDSATAQGIAHFSVSPPPDPDKTAFLTITLDTTIVFGIVPIQRDQFIVVAPGDLNHAIVSPVGEVSTGDTLYIPEMPATLIDETTRASDLLKSNYALTPIITDQSNPVQKFVSSRTNYKNNVEMVFHYADRDQNGIVDGTNVLETTLKGYRFNTLTGYYDLAPSARVDAENNVVYLPVTEFGIFTLLGSPSENNITRTVSYPNPFFINDPNFNDGKRYITINTFTTNHAYLRLKIYSVAGELVRKVDNPPNVDLVNGTVRWYGMNDISQYVTRGVYFYVIESDKGHATGKITVVE